MSTWRMIRFKLYVATPFVVIPLIAGFVFWDQCFKKLPDAKVQLGVMSQDFKEPMHEAMDIWNNAAGCRIFVPGDDVWWGSTDGEPCGLAFHPSIEDGHSAGAYKCTPSELRPWRWELHVEKPGDIRTQTCIALHELGHVLGLEDSGQPLDLMHREWCPVDGKILWPRDSESKDVKKRFCD